jgi:glycyl-tRNA synthetase
MVSLDKIVSLAKRRGFVYQTSEIYGGIANSYDYGPLGVELLRLIKSMWWNEFITKKEDMVGIDSQIILHPKTWEVSGHVSSFFDPLVEDKVNHKRYRADYLIERWLEKHPGKANSIVVEDLSLDEMAKIMKENQIKSPDGNEVTEPKRFDLLFETSLGVVTGEKTKAYLRGETAQGIFTNFKNILNTTRVKLPFGVGQIGKSFRNEVTTGQFVFRTYEFEQAEIEYFFNPETNKWQKLLEDWKSEVWSFVANKLGITKKNLRWRRHTDKERSHYSKDTYDLDYNFPFGWKELWGLAYRADYDLTQHTKATGQDFSYTDPYTGKKVTPHVIEPAVGINRLFLMILTDAYKEEGERVYLKLNSSLAPFQVAVFPLLANKPDLIQKARQVYKMLKSDFRVYWDDRGNIGKRYRYMDEIGTPFTVTIDFNTLEEETVTVRNRNTMSQKRIAINQLISYLNSDEKQE